MRVMRKSRLYAAALFGVTLMLTGLPVTSAQAASSRPAAPLHDSFLLGVFCTAAGNCWAVGDVLQGSVTTNQVLHWNGTSWRRVSVPSPAGKTGEDESDLFAVRCLNAKDCWAVGEYSRDRVTEFGQALHWNGRKWISVAVPRVGGSKKGDVTELFDSTCSSSVNCWAVGDYGRNQGLSQVRQNLALHWNGKKWARATIASPGGGSPADTNELSAVRCFSASNCIADGSYGYLPGSFDYHAQNAVFHWNGKRWSKPLPTPNPGGKGATNFSVLNALACGSSTSCFGVGYYGTNSPMQRNSNEILRWNGKKFTRATGVPDPAGPTSGQINQLEGATCSSPKNCWAVGFHSDSAGSDVNEALRWNGKKWSAVSTPNPAGAGGPMVLVLNFLSAVRCISASNCWAVGYARSADLTVKNEILHWHGGKWTIAG
jgi:hypothetical protein